MGKAPRYHPTQLIQELVRERNGVGSRLNTVGQLDDTIYIGPPLNLKEGDPDNQRPTERRQGFVATFDTSDPEQAARYDTLTNMAAEGLVRFTMQRVDFDQSRGCYVAFVQGFVPYLAGPGQTAVNDVIGSFRLPAAAKENRG